MSLLFLNNHLKKLLFLAKMLISIVESSQTTYLCNCRCISDGTVWLIGGLEFPFGSMCFKGVNSVRFLGLLQALLINNSMTLCSAENVHMKWLTSLLQKMWTVFKNSINPANVPKLLLSTQWPKLTLKVKFVVNA